MSHDIRFAAASRDDLSAEMQQLTELLTEFDGMQSPPARLLRIWNARLHALTPWREQAQAYELLRSRKWWSLPDT